MSKTCIINTEKVLLRLRQIEKEHAPFFRKEKTCITDYVIKGFFTCEGFVNKELPLEIIQEIRTVLDEAYYETQSQM